MVASGSYRRLVTVPGYLHSGGKRTGTLLIVGDGPINLSKDPNHPRWLRLPDMLLRPAAAIESRRRLAELEPELIISTTGTRSGRGPLASRGERGGPLTGAFTTALAPPASRGRSSPMMVSSP